MTVQNCEREISLAAPPERIVAVNSSSVENLLALGLSDRIVAVAAERDAIREDLREEFDTLTQITYDRENTPSSEAVLEFEPDFIYSVYPSAFRDDGIMSREDLGAIGVESYLSPGRCPERDKSDPLEFEEFWGELTDLGRLLDASDKADEVVAEQKEDLEAARAAMPLESDSVTVFFWDMGTAPPTAGSCCGGPGMILRELGLDNVFEDVEGAWGDVSWEAVVERNPDMIVLADTRESFAEKRKYAAAEEALRTLPAFAEDRIVELPFAQTTPGLQSIDGITAISSYLTAQPVR